MENILETLIGQHRELKQQLDNAAAEVEKGENDKVIQTLNDFDKLLKEHIAIENGSFYPLILGKMRSKNMQTDDIDDFIKKMAAIAADIYEFLSKYKEASFIESDVKTFKQDLTRITSALVFRVTSEEDGVYLYWNL